MNVLQVEEILFLVYGLEVFRFHRRLNELAEGARVYLESDIFCEFFACSHGFLFTPNLISVKPLNTLNQRALM